MIVVPIVIAAISSMPPRISPRIGPLRMECLKLNEAVPSAVIGLDHYQG